MKQNVLVLTALSTILVGCASTGPTGGALFHDIKYGKYATTNTAETKTGEACQKSFLGLVGNGDASVEAAKKAGGITKVSSIDASSFNVLGFYNKYCTIIKGE